MVIDRYTLMGLLGMWLIWYQIVGIDLLRVMVTFLGAINALTKHGEI